MHYRRLGRSGLLVSELSFGSSWVTYGSQMDARAARWITTRSCGSGSWIPRNETVADLASVADELGCTLAQLALAWCLKNAHVSTVITGASRPQQVVENMGATDVAARLDPALLQRIDAIVGSSYD